MMSILSPKKHKTATEEAVTDYPKSFQEILFPTHSNVDATMDEVEIKQSRLGLHSKQRL